MKNFLIACCVAALLILPHASYADTGSHYYLEIGHDSPPSDAQKEWGHLSETHKDLLGHLKFYPKKIIRDGVTTAMRIQAGPLASKSAAEKTCLQLFRDGVPCFVIEGVGNKPPASIVSLSERAGEKPTEVAALPWIRRAPPATTEQPPQATLPPLPWLVSQPPKKGEVKVAEAVRVPVSQPPEETLLHEPITEEPLTAPPVTSPAPAAPLTVATLPAPRTAGWLNVHSFLDQEVASEFWNNVKTGLHERANGLQARIAGPAVPGSEPNTVLTVGPFASRDDAYAFCTDHIQIRDSGLRCMFEKIQPEPLVPPDYHGEAYQARRQRANETRRELTEATEPPGPSAGSMTMYWLQVLNAPTELDAVDQWDDMKTANADLLDGIRSSILPATGDMPGYIVRLGPVTGGSDARKLCDILKERGVACRLLQYSSR